MSLDRVTNAALSRNILSDNQSTLARLARLQEQLATGKRVNRPSDDPLATRQSLRLRVDDLKLAKYGDNIEKSLSFVDSADDAFTAMGKSLDEVKQLAVQGANATGDATSRKALARAVDAQLRQMVDLANSSFDGRYLFGGTATTGQTPFVDQGDVVAYRGNLDEFSVQVTPTANEAVNRNGHALFKDGADVFAPLIRLRDALNANDVAGVRGVLADIDAAHTQVTAAQGEIGGQVRRLETARDQMAAVQTTIKTLVSKAEDADLPSTISELQLAQTALQAGLQSGASVMQRSLLDYL